MKVRSLGEPLEYRDVFKLLVKGGVLPLEKEIAFLNLAEHDFPGANFSSARELIDASLT